MADLTREEAAAELAADIAAYEAELLAMKSQHELATRPEYPKVLYSRSNMSGVLVNTFEEETALGAGWEDSPAKFGIETHPGQK